MDIGKRGGEEEKEGKEFDESCLFRIVIKLGEASRHKGLCITLKVYWSHYLTLDSDIRKTEKES